MDRLCSDASVLRALSAAKTTPTVEHTRGADVHRLRSDVFVLRLVRCLTFELTWRLRNDRQALEKTIYRMALEGPVWHAVGSQVERRVRHRWEFVCTGVTARPTTGQHLNLGHVTADGLKLSKYGGKGFVTSLVSGPRACELLRQD